MVDKIVGIENPPIETTVPPPRIIHDHFDGAEKCVDCDGPCELRGLDLFVTQLITDIMEETAWISIHGSGVIPGSEGGIRFELGPVSGKRIGSLLGIDQFNEFAGRALTTSADKYPPPVEPLPEGDDELQPEDQSELTLPEGEDIPSTMGEALNGVDSEPVTEGEPA
jgi:hypothetical protein